MIKQKVTEIVHYSDSYSESFFFRDVVWFVGWTNILLSGYSEQSVLWVDETIPVYAHLLSDEHNQSYIEKIHWFFQAL